jgi:hypothetical protein
MLKTVMERTALGRGFVGSKVDPYQEMSVSGSEKGKKHNTGGGGGDVVRKERDKRRKYSCHCLLTLRKGQEWPQCQ